VTTEGEEISRQARYRGALLGLAVGDAIGTTVEFRNPGTFEPVVDMTGGGPFDLPAGAWTDDTSMALCLADSLLACRGFDPVDQLSRYVRWSREGHRSSTGECFDIGGSTAKALARFERTGEHYPGDDDPDGAGNGPLMKLAPVPMAYAQHPHAALDRAQRSARTTHGAPQAAGAARYMAALLIGTLNGGDLHAMLADPPHDPTDGAWSEWPLHDEVAAVAGGSYRSKEPPEIRGGGYVVAALEAALWALDRNHDFRSTVLAAANLGDDADTTAAIAGQLAGAEYGVDGIPAEWRERVYLGDEIVALADGLLELSEEIDPAGDSL
jgi:ADP-ribosyl-[dinitrogen reductase] hydrolase